MHDLDGLVATWQEKTLTALNDEAAVAVQEFFELICDVRINSNISFSDKLLFLRNCVGNINLPLEAGFKPDLFESWCNGSQPVAPEMQGAILGLCIDAFAVKIKSFDSISQALVLLKHQTPVMPVSVAPLPFDPWLSIREIELSVRCYNCLYNGGLDWETRQLKVYRFLGVVVQATEAELMTISNFGSKSLQELKEALKLKGAHLNMQHPELDRFNEELKESNKAAI